MPADLARPPAAYRLRVAAMIGGLFAFLLLYIALTLAAGWLAYWLAASPMPDARGRGVFYIAVAKFGGAAAAGLLCLFLVKGLFKGQKVERSGHLPLREADHPDLFRFVRRVYEDAGAPPPRRVVVSPDVNAALVYDTSLVNLVVPPKKDLLIGLGLANVVDLVEFKAVLEHFRFDPCARVVLLRNSGDPRHRSAPCPPSPSTCGLASSPIARAA